MNVAQSSTSLPELQQQRAAWHQGMALFAKGEYWECHEVLEPLWLEAEGLDKHFYAGVILLAAALHKARSMASPRGGRRNYAKALAHLLYLDDCYGNAVTEKPVAIRQLEAQSHAALCDAQQKPRIPYCDARV